MAFEGLFVHANIKSSNILLNEDNTVRLGGIGWASSRTPAGSADGTAHVDICNVGILFLELLTGWTLKGILKIIVRLPGHILDISLTPSQIFAIGKNEHFIRLYIKQLLKENLMSRLAAQAIQDCLAPEAGQR